MIAVLFQPVIMRQTALVMDSVLISMFASATKVGLERNVHNIHAQTWITAQVMFQSKAPLSQLMDEFD